MDQVDEDKSGQIEFNEFLHIIKNASNNKEKQKPHIKVLYQFLPC